MKIQPESHNAITMILDDGTEFKIHHTIHGTKDCLFVQCKDDLQVDTLDAPTIEWQLAITANMIRITSKKGGRQ